MSLIVVCSQIFFTATFKNDATLLGDILDIWYADIQPIINITDFLPSLVFQPLTEPIIHNFAKNGGNALGIIDADGPLTSKLSCPPDTVVRASLVLTEYRQ